MRRTRLTPELVDALKKTLSDETLTAEDKLHIAEFLATNVNKGITDDDVWNLLTVVYKLYDLFKDHLE